MSAETTDDSLGDEYDDTRFRLVADKYPMSVRSDDARITIGRYSRDCPPDQVNYLCEMDGIRLQVRGTFSHDLSRFCEIVTIQASDLMKAMSSRSNSVAGADVLRMFLVISPAINELSRLFKGDHFGPFCQTFEVLLLDPDRKVLAQSRLKTI